MVSLTVVYCTGVVHEHAAGGQPHVDHGRLAQSADVPGSRSAVQLARVRRAVLVRARRDDEPARQVRGLVMDAACLRVKRLVTE